ncbi:MAG TPA: hypothetical protein PLN69_08940 [bacterium]|nr:hypothetical protein [bacterium]
MRRYFTLTIFAALMVVYSNGFCMAQSGEQVVKVEGYAAITGNASISDLRTAATDDALSMAVRQVVGLVLDSQSYSVDFEIVEKSIITRANGYARVGKILYETRLPDQYIVGIEAIVSTEKLENDIDSLKIDIMRAGDPRIVVVIPEELLFRRQVPDPAGETEIIRQLVENGFTVVDQTEVGEIRYGTEIERILAGDSKSAGDVFKGKADILIVGEAMAERVGDVGGGLISCRGRIEIKAIEIGTGRIITSFAAHEAGIDITDVLAGKKTLENTADVVASHLKDKLAGYVSSGGRYVRVEIKNISDQQALFVIKQALSSAGGVNIAYIRSYTGGTAVLDLDCTCGAKLLAPRIEGMYLKDMSLMINAITPGKIEASLNYQ